MRRTPKPNFSPQLVDQDQDLPGHGDIEGCGRFIQNQQSGSAQQRHGDHGALQHAAREFVRIAAVDPFGVRQADQSEMMQDFSFTCRTRHPPVAVQHVPELPAQGKDRVECRSRVLENNGHRAVAVFARGSGIRGDADLTGPPCATGKDAEGGEARKGFAAACLAHEAEDFASGNVQVNPPDGLVGNSAAVREFDFEVADAK